MNTMSKMIFSGLITGFLLAALALACNDSAAPKFDPHVCDREKRAVWNALGNTGAPPDSLMKVGEWTLPGSMRPPVESETYYFMQFAGEPGCHVMRA